MHVMKKLAENLGINCEICLLMAGPGQLLLQLLEPLYCMESKMGLCQQKNHSFSILMTE